MQHKPCRVSLLRPPPRIRKHRRLSHRPRTISSVSVCTVHATLSIHTNNPPSHYTVPAYLLASPSGSAQLSASHYTPLNSSGFPLLGLRHPLDASPLPATPSPGSQEAAAAAAAAQPLAPLAEEGAQYPSPAGTLVPPRGAEQRWSLGPVPTKVAPVGVHNDKEEAAVEAKESFVESVSSPEYHCTHRLCSSACLVHSSDAFLHFRLPLLEPVDLEVVLLKAAHHLRVRPHCLPRTRRQALLPRVPRRVAAVRCPMPPHQAP